ncbi:MAG: O-antigen ligase family protein [Actinomycetota bacterium]|nr:O-antigen ligase family protein [Actinomycetota bacterium]
MDLRVMHPTGAIPRVELRAGTESRSRALEIGLGLIVIIVPLAFLPMSMGPFLDVKVVVLLAGALVLWRWYPGGSKLGVPAALWVGTVAVAGVFGVDRWWSVVGPENIGNGLLLLGPSALILVAATRVPEAFRLRIPLWLAGTSAIVASVALVSKVWPRLPIGEAFVLPLDGGTLIHPVFMATFVAVGIVAVVGLPTMSARILAPLLVLLSSAVALSTKRVGWVALAVGLALALWKTRPPRNRVVLVLGVVAATMTAWTAIDAVLTPSASLSGARRFGELGAGSSSSRVGAWTALSRGWGDRPVFGWGPGNTWSAYVAAGIPSQLRVERGYGDSHNIVIEMAVTTGIVGVGAFLLLAGFTIREMRKGSPPVGWAAGAAAALFVHHLIQPLNVVLTPLLFLTAGLACVPPAAAERRGGAAAGIRAPRVRRFARGFVGVLLGAGLLVAVAVLVSSVLERYGRTYASESALRTSLQVYPGRITAGEALAMSLALDARSGDAEAGVEAGELIARMVRLHPWNPGVRLVAADVHTLMRDPAGAAEWTKRHFARFPKDVSKPRRTGDEPPSGRL